MVVDSLVMRINKANCTLPLLGQFCWDEIRMPLKLCTYMFSSREDRQAIRAFLKYEDEFKSQPSYLELKPTERANHYNSSSKTTIFV